MFVFGGFCGDQSTTVSSLAYRFDLQTETIESIQSMPQTLTQMGARYSQVTGLHYIFGFVLFFTIARVLQQSVSTGGRISDYESLSDNIYAYNPTSDEYSLLGTSLSVARWGMRTLEYDDVIFLFGGVSASEPNYMYTDVFVPETKQLFKQVVLSASVALTLRWGVRGIGCCSACGNSCSNCGHI